MCAFPHEAIQRQALIISADDFGLHPRINEAVELAHRYGVLTAASLMVGAPAAADAIERARALPKLRVGLHLVLTDGEAILSQDEISALVDASGRFGDNMMVDGFRYFFLPHVRSQLALEIRAQFEAFARSGLELDHVNTHKHFHLHPTVLSMIIGIGRDYGMRAVRLPGDVSASLWLQPWVRRVRARLASNGLAYNDYVIGIADTGRMSEVVWLEALQKLPPGIGEIYCHPAVAGEAPITPSMLGYCHVEEFAALLSPRVAQAIAGVGATLSGFADVCCHRGLGP